MEKLDRHDVRLSVSEANVPYLIEGTSDLRTFVPLVLMTNEVVLSSTQHIGAFRAERVSPMTESYFERANISDVTVQSDVHRWMANLEAAGLLQHVVYMASYATEHVGFARASIPALVGSDARCSGAPSFGTNGLIFDGTFWLELTNPFPSESASAPLKEMSIFAAFTGEGGARGLLIGNDGGEGRAGPAFWVGGDPYIAPDPENIAFTCTADGRVNSQPGFRGASTFNWGNRLVPEVALAGVSSTGISIQVDIDREYSVPVTQDYPVANPGPTWRIGARQDGTLPFKGALSFVTVFGTNLGSSDLSFLRATYLRTIGRSVHFPSTQLVMEGDSLSEEAFETEYGHWLQVAPHWQGKFFKRNIAHFGDTTGQMLAEFDAEVPKAVGEKNYLFLWGGRNDLAWSTAEEIFGRLKSYWGRARQVGYKVAAFTIIPAAYESQESDAAQESAQKRRQLNDLIRSAAGADYDILFDVDGIPALQDATDQRYFKVDGIHLTAAGSQEIAKLIDGALLP